MISSSKDLKKSNFTFYVFFYATALVSYVRTQEDILTKFAITTAVFSQDIQFLKSIDNHYKPTITPNSTFPHYEMRITLTFIN